jgi:hypothetical protein
MTTQSFLESVGEWTQLSGNEREEEIRTLLVNYFNNSADEPSLKFRNNSGYLEVASSDEIRGYVITSKGDKSGKWHIVKRNITARKYAEGSRMPHFEFEDSNKGIAGFSWRLEQ